jgi:alkanesulfonate monooxygenase SsuD/methylene tetrahydromethanopterin reductase-like flavin-dependent oxidoreductase (luciferase family)
VQAELPIWVGGGGEKRTLRIAARYADAWNVPFISPEDFARKRGVLGTHCEAIGRDPSTITCAVNVGLAYTDESLRQQFGALAEGIRPGVLTGSDDQILDALGRYADAGADQINIAMRAPWMTEDLERLAPLILSQ